MSLDQQQFDLDVQRALEIKENGSKAELQRAIDSLRTCYGVIPEELKNIKGMEPISDVHENMRYAPDPQIVVSLCKPEPGDESSQAA